MRIAELSRATGVPVPTIKYYLREGLLPQGEMTSPNQARYGDRHVERLRLVRVLVEIGRLPIATIGDLLRELDTPEPNVHHLLGRALKAATADCLDTSQDPLAVPLRTVDEIAKRHDWRVSPNAPARRAVAEVLDAMRQLGMHELLGHLDDYAALAGEVARVDLATVRTEANPAAMVYSAVIGAILGDVLFAGLRRMAQESESAASFEAGRSLGAGSLGAGPSLGNG
jgi:DNA-binding transcriptional MerR regulator